MGLPSRYDSPVSIHAENLACVRGGRGVFQRLSFSLAPGELLLLTGPNGSGKSSLLRLLAGLLPASSGRLLLATDDRGSVGLHFLGHSDGLKPALTLRETLRFWTVLGQAATRPVDSAAAAGRVGLAHALDLPVATLSAGQRRRAGLARLVLVPRALWLLDEPTAALDSDGETLLGELLAEHRAAGGCAVAATHGPLPVSASAVVSFGRAA